jgi:uridine kinase
LNINAQQATLTFLLSVAYRRLYSSPSLVIEHSFADGLFCHHHDWTSIPHSHISEIKTQMNEWITNDSPIEITKKSKDWVLTEFAKYGLFNKPSNIEQWGIDPIPIVQFQTYWDYQIEPMETNKQLLENFDLIPYNKGMLLRFPTLTSPGSIPKFIDKPKLYSIIEENEQWGSILGIESIPKLNEHIEYNGIKDLIWVAEGLHEKKLSQIADSISELFTQKRIISIAGPSSSGKTSFAKRLSIHLKVNGFSTLQISMDDYFVDRDKIPLNQNGEQNFESFDVLDSELLSKRIQLLLDGHSVPVRKYDFETGKGIDTSDTIQIQKNQFIIIEGIHGLNTELTSNISNGKIHKIFVSAITQLNIDGDHRFSTADNRLFRRMVRDNRFRGYTPEETIARWKSVRLGEEKNIFPFQEEADFMFNSALIYELPVLAHHCKKLLSNIKRSLEFSSEIDRLLTLTSFFKPLDENKVPGISILREFIGNSDFDY